MQPFILEESPVDTMADQRTMAELRAPTEGYAGAIVVPPILAEQFELKHNLINMMNSDQFFRLEKDNPHDHICGNLLERRTQDVLMIIENKSKQTSAVTTTMTTILKRFQATPPSAFVKAVKEICVTCGGAHPYYHCLAADGNTFSELRDNIQGYVATAAVNYNQGNSGYHPPGVANQIRPSGFAQPNVRDISLATPLLTPKGELKAITTQSGIVLDGPSIPIPPPFINPEEDERVEETLTDQDLAKDPLHPNIPYPSRMHKQKQQEKDEVQIHKFWQMFKQLHINITLDDALILILKYQKMLKALLFNKEKLLELENIPLNENYSAVILKKLPEKLGYPGKFLIPYSFSKLKCKALANLDASINLKPLSVWKKLGLPELISTRITFELVNRAICTPDGIARDVFVLVGKFTFPTDFVIVDYESDPRVPLILERPFLRTARALIDVHGEEMILHDDDDRLTLNMRHDTSSYSNQPQKESINMINIFNDSNEDFHENLFETNNQSGNLTFSSHPKLTSPKVKDDVFDPEGGNDLIEKLLDLDSTKDPHEKLLNINLLIAKIKSLNDNHTSDHVLKPLSSSPIPIEDSDSEEYDSFLCEIEPDQGKLTSVVMKDNLAKPRVHVPNVLTTHPTLMLDSDFIPSDNSLLEFETFYFDIEEKNSGSTTIYANISLSDLECFNFNDKPDQGKLTSIVDSGIHENDISTTNVNLPPEEDHSPLFVYVVWIFLSFLTYPVVPLNLLSFGNEDTIFDPGISNYHFPSLLLDVSHRCETFIKFNVYSKLLNESPMEILSSLYSPMES
nr:hypothetical protein [Tanacetum cinerariifolium]